MEVVSLNDTSLGAAEITPVSPFVLLDWGKKKAFESPQDSQFMVLMSTQLDDLDASLPHFPRKAPDPMSRESSDK